MAVISAIGSNSLRSNCLDHDLLDRLEHILWFRRLLSRNQDLGQNLLDLTAGSALSRALFLDTTGTQSGGE
ncbi:MAG TPA: hypothetical protein VKP67_29010 [Xanthobacteraceae bacterium]|nr:hypothetical protein [Xanthobacteraceae bacterium]